MLINLYRATYISVAALSWVEYLVSFLVLSRVVSFASIAFRRSTTYHQNTSPTLVSTVGIHLAKHTQTHIYKRQRERDRAVWQHWQLCDFRFLCRIDSPEINKRRPIADRSQTGQLPVEMGVIFLEHIGGSRLFSCASCDTNLTNRSQLVSTRFTGATGRAFLFNKVVNLNYRCVLYPFRLSYRNVRVRRVSDERASSRRFAHCIRILQTLSIYETFVKLHSFRLFFLYTVYCVSMCYNRVEHLFNPYPGKQGLSNLEETFKIN